MRTYSDEQLAGLVFKRMVQLRMALRRLLGSYPNHGPVQGMCVNMDKLQSSFWEYAESELRIKLPARDTAHWKTRIAKPNTQRRSDSN